MRAKQIPTMITLDFKVGSLILQAGPEPVSHEWPPGCTWNLSASLWFQHVANIMVMPVALSAACSLELSPPPMGLLGLHGKRARLVIARLPSTWPGGFGTHLVYCGAKTT